MDGRKNLGLMDIAAAIFCDPFLRGKIDEGYISGSSTYVAPLTVWKESGEFVILIKTYPRCSRRHFNAFIKEQLQKYPELEHGHFERNDLSCPDKLLFRIKKLNEK